MQIDVNHLPSPAELEQFYLPFPDGDPAARIGLRMEFYFRRPGEADLRTRLVDCIEQYLTLAEDRMILYRVAGDRRYRPLKPGQRVDMSKVRAMINPGRFIFEASAADIGIAQPWSISVMSSQITFRDDQLGHLEAYLPLTALKNAPPRMFTRLFLEFCEALAVEHAYGGLGWVLPFDVGGSNGAVRLPTFAVLIQRFCALDVSDVGSVANEFREGIKSVAWLTAVSHRLLESLGGADAVAKATGPDIVLHPYSNGVVFQAGATPQIGDTEQNLIPPAYLALGRALKPIRVRYPYSMFTAPPGYGPVPPGEDPDNVFTRDWLARFDGD